MDSFRRTWMLASAAAFKEARLEYPHQLYEGLPQPNAARQMNHRVVNIPVEQEQSNKDRGQQQKVVSTRMTP